MPSPSPADRDSSLCGRIQQLRQHMRSRCMEAHRAADATPDAKPAMSLPCLLQSWRKRIEAMDDTEPRPHRAGRRLCGQHLRRAGHAPASASSSSTASSESEDQEPTASPLQPACPGFGAFGGPRTLHPRLERQQAVCSLSGLWSGLTSSPPPSPEIYAKPRHRRHPYARCQEDRGASSTE